MVNFILSIVPGVLLLLAIVWVFTLLMMPFFMMIQDLFREARLMTKEQKEYLMLKRGML